MTNEKKNKRRTKLQIDEDNALAFFKTVGIDAESEEGQRYLTNIREKHKKNKSRTNVSPELSAAKKLRLSLKRDIEKMNRQANMVLDAEKELTKDNITATIQAFKEADAMVIENGGETMDARDGGLNTYLKKKYPADQPESATSL